MSDARKTGIRWAFDVRTSLARGFIDNGLLQSFLDSNGLNEPSAWPLAHFDTTTGEIVHEVEGAYYTSPEPTRDENGAITDTPVDSANVVQDINKDVTVDVAPDGTAIKAGELLETEIYLNSIAYHVNGTSQATVDPENGDPNKLVNGRTPLTKSEMVERHRKYQRR